MAHQVQQMFSVKEVPWHGLGHVITDAPTAAEGIKLAGLDWEAVQGELFMANGQKIETHKVLTRSDTGAQLGVVGTDFHPVQNITAFDFINPFVEAGEVTLETAGCLRGGKTVWVLAKLNKEPMVIGNGDTVLKYFLFSNGHDGSMTLRTGFCPIRVVCANTLGWAHTSNDAKLIRLRHTKNIHDNLQVVRETINMADARFQATAEQFQYLSKSDDVCPDDIKRYVEVVFDTASVTDAERRRLRQERFTKDITRLFETGRGAELKTARGTYWGLYNAVTEYLTYEHGRNDETRLNQLWFGGNVRVNQRAFQTAMKMAQKVAV